MRLSLTINLLRSRLNTRCLLSTQVSVKEVQEALDHVGHEDRETEQGRERLDRNRYVNNHLTYRVVGMSDLQKVHGLLYASFHPDEPITKHLGLCKGLNSIPDADRMVEEILTKNLAVLAEDSTGKAVAVSVNNACYGVDLTSSQLASELGEVQDPSYKPLVAIHHQLRLMNTHIYREVGTERFFSIRMVAVDPMFRDKGIATDVIRRSVLLAGSLGYVGIKTEATGFWSRRAFQTIGLLPTSSIRYADFTYEGEKVLGGGGLQGQEITFLKKKFFQSALKHIL